MKNDYFRGRGKGRREGKGKKEGKEREGERRGEDISVGHPEVLREAADIQIHCVSVRCDTHKERLLEGGKERREGKEKEEEKRREEISSWTSRRRRKMGERIPIKLRVESIFPKA